MKTYVEVAFFENNKYGRYRGISAHVLPGSSDAVISGVKHILGVLGREFAAEPILPYHWLGAEAEAA